MPKPNNEDKKAPSPTQRETDVQQSSANYPEQTPLKHPHGVSDKDKEQVPIPHPHDYTTSVDKKKNSRSKGK